MLAVKMKMAYEKKHSNLRIHIISYQSPKKNILKPQISKSFEHLQLLSNKKIVAQEFSILKFTCRSAADKANEICQWYGIGRNMVRQINGR